MNEGIKTDKEIYIGANVKCRYCKKEVSAFSIFRHERECLKVKWMRGWDSYTNSYNKL